MNHFVCISGQGFLLDRLFWHVFILVLYSSLLKGKLCFVPLAVLGKIINLLSFYLLKVKWPGNWDWLSPA